MSRTRFVLALLAGGAAGLGAPLLWQHAAPAPAQAQTSQAAPVATSFALNEQEWVVVNTRGDATVYTRDGSIIRRCVMRASGPSVIDCRNPF